MAKNEQYSNADFTGRQFLDRPAAEFAGEIVGSCFHQYQPDTAVFPAGTVCAFQGCNLDNVAIPPGCTLDGCTNKRIATIGGEAYSVHADGSPIELLNQATFDADKAARIAELVQEGIAVTDAHYPPYLREAYLLMLVQAMAAGHTNQAGYCGQVAAWCEQVLTSNLAVQAAIQLAATPTDLAAIEWTDRAAIEAADPGCLIGVAMRMED